MAGLMQSVKRTASQAKPVGQQPDAKQPARTRPTDSSGRPERYGRGQAEPVRSPVQPIRPRPGGGGSPQRPDLSSLDNRDSGMLYPGSKFREQPRQFHDKQTKLRIIPLGGLEEIGMNCLAIEYGPDIIVIDLGWMFPDETMPGIDYVIPDVSYLEKKKQNIRGVFITHGHLDHIGAAPYLLPKLGFPTVYASKLCRAIMESNIEEHDLKGRPKFTTVGFDDRIQAGSFTVEFFHVNHNIPEGMGMAITTPVGTIVHSGDFKFDATPVADTPAHLDRIEAIGQRGVLLAMCDSTNVERPGHTISEADISRNMEQQIAKAPGRVIMATFSTLIARLQGAITAAHKNNRKVTVLGRSMLRNIEISQRLGYIDIPKDILVDSRQLRRYPDKELLVLCTGSQADEMSALARMARGEHKQLQIKSGDTVILSSSPIPGNENSINMMMDSLFRQGADVIYAKLLDIHTTGHAYQEELKQMLQMLKPQHFMPVHGEYRKRVMHGRLAGSVGVPSTNVHLPDNGSVFEANHQGDVGLTKEKVGGGVVFVDGLGVGDVGNVVLRDRKHMAADGMFVIIVTVDRRNGKLTGSPDIISRGFVYLKESGDLLQQVRAQVRQAFQDKKVDKPGDWGYLKNRLRDDIGDFLYDKTQRHPMVLPVIIEV